MVNILGKRFKRTFRIARTTFSFIHEKIKNDITKQHISGKPISTEERLAICLYRLSRGDYYHTVADMTGVGESTVCIIVREVTEAIVDHLWTDVVESHFPHDKEMLYEKVKEKEQEWQFPYAYAAVDGCHIPIKCPSGGQEAAKEYHNFKNLYSIVLMGMVDAKYCFIWASAGFPGNSHDSIIFQATNLYAKIAEGKSFHNLLFEEIDIQIPPIILGDSAFPFKP